ncbi:hypothetical protein [Lactococcus lactis]|mgnify:CR=1 FL=1|uniref:hypothetical protein n=1 Tax=Lactococcus lactis TaxID=1358 RepID=UPI0019149BB9|nr:hypothetical protein [Lactococcus lactis]MCT0449254.1 hypothetical protein [Lactococcus lactis subsp. lactis]WDA69638.1 hypothetical protein IL310_06250 [Lactococcus lactis]
MEHISMIGVTPSPITAKQATISLLQLINKEGNFLLKDLARVPNYDSYKKLKFLIDHVLTSLQFIEANHVVSDSQVVRDISALEVFQRQLHAYGAISIPLKQDHALKELCHIAIDKLGFRISDKIINRIEHQDLRNLPF